MTSKKALKAINKSLDFIQMKFGVLLYKKEWINAIKQDLKVLEILKNRLDANTLFRVFPYKTAKSFSDFIKAEEKVKEWLERKEK